MVQLPSTVRRDYRVIYYVKYEDKEWAKKQGAKWNPNLKFWYRNFTCYNDEDIKEVSAEACGIRILDIHLEKETIMPGQIIKMDNINEEELINIGCKIISK